MKPIVSALCVFVLAIGTLRLAAQVNPYKEGTPGVSGYRSEVLAEVIIQEDKFTRLAEAIPGDKPESLDSAAALLTVSQAKGLEFDRVIVADPSGILAQSPNGGHDLYVAITRATHRLTVVYEGSLPPSLGSLSSVKTDG